MQIETLELNAFRNYQNERVLFSPGVNLLCGENAQGKTNLLEAIFLLTGSRTWRSAKKSELILFGREEAQIKAQVQSRGRQFSLKLYIPQRGKAGIWINQVKENSSYALSGVFRCVLFSPEDLSLIRAGAQVRREFLNDALVQLSPRYAKLLDGYCRLLEQKNRVLKAGENRPRLIGVLPEYNAQLIKLGARLIGFRAKLVKALSVEAQKTHRLFSGRDERLTLSYQTVSSVLDPLAEITQIESWLTEHMAAHHQAELLSGNCLSGVHRDDLLISIDGQPARSFASQGQARTAAIALKFAVRELFFQDMGEYPLLLLDDVLSELDERRQRLICSHAMGGQTIITCCALPDALSTGAVMHIQNGAIKTQR